MYYFLINIIKYSLFLVKKKKKKLKKKFNHLKLLDLHIVIKYILLNGFLLFLYHIYVIILALLVIENVFK